MTDNGAAPPPELIATGPARICVIERAGGGVRGQSGLRLTDARGPAGARLRRRFDQLSMSARPAPGLAGRGAVCWRAGTGDSAAEVSGRWEAAGADRFLLASGGSGTGPGAGETLDGVLRRRPGGSGEWELDLIYTHAAAAWVTLARVRTVCTAVTPSLPRSTEQRGTAEPGGLPVCLPYHAEISGTRHREQAPAAGAGSQEPERAWLDLLCTEFDLTLNCVQGIAGKPAVPAVLMAFPADIRLRLFEFSLIAAGTPGQPGFISWSLSGLSSAKHVSEDRLTVTGPSGPQWFADDSTLIAVADAKLELTHDITTHSVAGELTVTGTTGRVFRALVAGSWRGSAAAAVRHSLAAPDFTGPWRGILGTDAMLAVGAAADGWWRPAEPAASHPGPGQPGPLFLRHATGPDLAVGITADGSLVALERAEPAVTGEAAVSDGAGLRTVGQRLMQQQRYAEALRLLGRAAACFARQADAAERTGHEIAARNYLVSASASSAERAFCALALSDYPALRRCLTEDIGWRRRLVGLAPGRSSALLAGARQLPGSLDNWRLRLDEDAARIDSVSAGPSFYGLLAQFMLDHGAVEDALVAAELGRARAFADLLASPGGASGGRAGRAQPRGSAARCCGKRWPGSIRSWSTC